MAKTNRQLNNAYKKYMESQPERVGFAQSRMDSIGGSDVASILNDPDAYLTEYELYLSKTTLQADDEDNDLLLIGSCLENGIIDIYSKKVKGVNVDKNPESRSYASHPWLVGNPDALCDDGEKKWGLEIKNLGFCDPDLFGNELTFVGGEIIEPENPAFVIPKFNFQCQFYMEIFDLEFMDLVALFKGGAVKAYRIKRYPQLGAYIMSKATDWFFTHVIPRVPPAPTNEDTLSTYYNQVNEEVVHLSTEQYKQVQKLKKIKARIKELEGMGKGLQHELCEHMRGAQVALHEGKEVFTWKQQDNWRIDTDGIKRKYPDFYKNNRKNKPSRVLRLK